MSWKSARNSGEAQAGAKSRRQWSLAVRLAAGFSVAAFSLLLVASALLYWALANNLDQEDNEYLGEKIALIERLLKNQPGNAASLQTEVDRESQQHFYPPVMIRVLDSKGQVLAETHGMSETMPATLFPKAVSFHSGQWNAVPFLSATGRPFGMISATVNVDSAGRGDIVQAALDQTQEEVLLARYRGWLWLVLGLGWIVSALVGYGIARRGLKPILRMAGTVRSIDSESLNERVEPAGFPAELSSLAETFNGMLRRLEDSFTRLSQFSADIAHELRTPINNVRGLVEVALGRARAGQPSSDLLGPCLDECQRLSRLIDNLLFVARAERPQGQIQRQHLKLCDELETVREFYEAAATEAHVSIDVCSSADVEADLDRTLFQRALGNLIENAIAYTPRDGKVSLTATRVNGTVRVEVADSGCGIPAHHLPRLFERFYRVDPSRSKHTGGMGLGLAIVKSIVALHGGRVEVASEVGVGSRFTLEFPADEGVMTRV